MRIVEVIFASFLAGSLLFSGCSARPESRQGAAASAAAVTRLRESAEQYRRLAIEAESRGDHEQALYYRRAADYYSLRAKQMEQSLE